jgi:broad specificity phosphatase PhoE
METTLSRRGQMQMQTLVEALGHRSVELVYSSPTACARQLAAGISAGQLPIYYRTGLADVDAGSWTGKTWREVYYDDSARALAYLNDPENHGYPDGETLLALQERVFKTVDGCMRQHENQTLAVVTHPLCSCTVLAHLLKQPLRRIRDIEQDHGAVNVLRLMGGHIELCAANHVFQPESRQTRDKRILEGI